MARYKVTSPEGKEYVLNGPEGASRDQVLEALKYKLGGEQEEYRPDRGLLEAGGAGLRRGVERFKSTIGDVLPAMVASGLGFEDYAKKQLAENAETERNIAKYNPPEFTSYKQADTPLKALKYGIESTSEVAPDIAASLVPGGIGGAIGRRVGMGALREAGVLGAEQLAKEEARRGAMGTSLGVYLGSYAQNAPEVFNSIYQETGQMEPGVAALFGSVSAGLDSVLPASILRSMSGPARVGVVEKILERSGMQPGLLRKVVSQIPEAAAKEGLTESAQEAINISAEDFVKKTEHIWGSKEWDRIVESGVRGAIAGGAFGAPAGVGERFAERRQEQAARDEAIRKEQEQISNLLPEEPTSIEEAQRQIELLRGLPQSEIVAEKIAELEAYEPPPPPPPEAPASLITKDVLNETGLKPQSGYYKQMAGKDMLVPEEAAKVDEVLDRMRKNKKLDPAILTSVEDLITTARTPVEEFAQEEVAPTEQVTPPVAEVIPEDIVEPEASVEEATPTTEQTEQEVTAPEYFTAEEAIDRLVTEGNVAKDSAAKYVNDIVSGYDTVDAKDVDAIIEQNKVKPIYRTQDDEAKGMLREQVESLRDKIIAGWTNAPKIQVVQNPEELEDRLQQQMIADKVTPPGLFDPQTETVFLIGDHLKDSNDAALTIAHEALGHYGLRGLLADTYEQTMNDIYNGNLDVRKETLPYMARGLDQATATEEVLAKMAEQGKYNNAVQRVMNAIRQFLKKIGVINANKISNAEIRELLANANRFVIAGAPTKKGAAAFTGKSALYRTNAQNNLNIISGSITGLPKMSDDIKEGFLNAASNIPDGVRRAALGFLTMPQIEQLYGDALPSLKKLTKALEARAVDMQTRRQDISKNVTNWFSIAQKHKSVLPKFFDIANRTTLDQIDVLDPAFAGHPLTKKFQSLPPELQKVYKELRASYKKSSDEYMNLLLQNLKQSPASVQRLKMEAKRMKVYLPLFRQGDYWVSYTNKAGERVSQSFDSQREANIAAEAITKTGIKDVKKFTRLQQISYRSVPPTGFMGTVVKDLEKANVKREVIDQIYQSYLSLFPAQSIRQQFRKREGRLGFTEDVLQVYANVATRMANQLANMKYAPDVEDSVTGVRKEFENDPSMEHRDVVDNMQKQLDFIRNPVNGDLVAKASYFSYMWYIAGNVSSALVNLTQMPIVVYPLLGGKYGFGKTADAMQRATAMYMKGGKDNNSEFLPDFTFGANAKGEFKQLYDAAVQRAAIRRSTGYELTEARKSKVEDFTGRRAKIEHGLGWIFQNSERANREITLIAAFDLARKSGKSVDVAIEEAISLVNDAHGASLSETGPRFFQQGIGKVAFTFKRFAQAQIYLLGRLFHEAFRGYDKKTRDIARNQLLGIAGMSYIFAGIQGMPMYGAISLLANMLMDDDDEPFDLDATIRKSMGDIGYKGPINQLLGVDIASRTGFNGLLWRDDPKRMAEIGPSLYMIEQAAGPAYGAFRNAERGLKLINEGEIERGMEALVPSFVRNGLKAFRLGTEGALTKDGIKITDDINAYNVFMQIWGFNPAELSEAQANAGAMKRAEQSIRDRRSALLDKLDGARVNGDSDGVSETIKAIQKFNGKNPEIAITAKTMASSFQSRRRREAESVSGVFLDRKLRMRLMDEYGGDQD
jgi:hypothetical protein